MQSNQALDAEKRRIHDFEIRCNQISQDQNKKIDELNLQVNSLSNINNDLKNEQTSLTSKLDSSKEKVNKLKEERDNFESNYKDLKTKKDDLDTKFNDLKKDHSTLKNEYKDLKIDYSNKEDYLKKSEDHFKKELGKLSQEKKDWEETIDKLNEESKKQLSEIENMENPRVYADKYLSDFYSLKTGEDGGIGEEFCMNIDWGRSAHWEVLKLARAVRCRCMKGIRIWSFEEEQNKDLLDYLTHNWPDQLRLFYFNAFTYIDGLYGSADYYLDGIAKVGQENILYI